MDTHLFKETKKNLSHYQRNASVLRCSKNTSKMMLIAARTLTHLFSCRLCLITLSNHLITKVKERNKDPTLRRRTSLNFQIQANKEMVQSMNPTKKGIISIHKIYRIVLSNHISMVNHKPAQTSVNQSFNRKEAEYKVQDSTDITRSSSLITELITIK